MTRRRQKDARKPNARRGMKRPVQHVIDTVGQGVFARSLDPTWVPNPLHEDYAKDYHVEVRDEEEFVTGEAFYVQLKSSAAAKYCFGGSVVSQKMDCDHLIHFADDVTLPVFVVVTDNAAERAYYLWVQEFLRTKDGWRDRASITIHVPTVNDLSNRKAFAQAVSRAVATSRLTQATLQERLGYEVAAMEAEDPRFRVRPTITRESCRFALEPVEPVTLQMTLEGPGSVIGVKAADLIDRGRPVEFSPGELTFKGSKLFEKFNRTGGRVRIAHHQPATASVILYDEAGAMLAELGNVPGTLEGGRKEVEFKSNLPGAAFELGIGPIPSKRGGYQLAFDAIAWEGQQVLRLGYFDTTYKFIRAIPKAAETAIEIYIRGNLEYSATLTNRTETEGIESAGEHLELLRMARVVAKRFGMNPSLRVLELGQPGYEQWIRTLHRLATDGWAMVRLTEPMSIPVAVDVLGDYQGGEVSLPSRGLLRPKMLGEQIEIGWHEVALLYVTLAFDPQEVEAAKRNGLDTAMVRVQPTPNSKFGVRLTEGWTIESGPSPPPPA